MTITPGDRVWWWHTPTFKRHGLVVNIDGMVGVRTENRELIYIGPEQLHTEEV